MLGVGKFVIISEVYVYFAVGIFIIPENKLFLTIVMSFTNLQDAFMPLVELVQTPNARTMMAKTVLSIFFQRCNSAHIDDHIVISSLMRLCCILHDSIK